MNETRKGFVLAVGAAILWGISGTFGQFLFEQRGVEAGWLVTVRMLLSGTLLLSLGAARKDASLMKVWKNRKDVTSLLIFSIFGMLAVQYTYFTAIRHSNAATATVLQYAGPVLIAAYMAIRKRRWPSLMEYLAIAFAIGGTYLLVTHGNPDTLSVTPAAIYWGLLSAVTLAFYSLQPAQLLKKFPASTIVGWALLLGGIALSFVHTPWQVSGTWDVYALLALLFIVVLGTLVPFYAYLTAVRLIGAEKSSLLASAEPLSAALFSIWWLKTPFSAVDWLGSFLILSTLFLLAAPSWLAARRAA